MIPIPNVLAGLLIGIVNTSWVAVLLACLVWPLVFCAYVSIVDSARRNATVADFRARGRRLVFGSPALSFYAIEFFTALMTSLLVACVAHFIKRSRPVHRVAELGSLAAATMTPLHLILLTTAAALCGFGGAMIAYSGYALPRGWRVGRLYVTDFSWLQGIAYLAILGSLVFGHLAVGWWGVIVVLVMGNILTRVLLPSAGEKTQVIAPPAVLLLGIACVVVWLLPRSGS